MALPKFPLTLTYPAAEECGARVEDANGYTLSDDDVAAINALEAKMKRILTAVGDTTLSPKTALDTVRAILEEE